MTTYTIRWYVNGQPNLHNTENGEGKDIESVYQNLKCLYDNIEEDGWEAELQDSIPLGYWLEAIMEIEKGESLYIPCCYDNDTLPGVLIITREN